VEESGGSTEPLVSKAARKAMAKRTFRSRVLAQLEFADFLAVMMVLSTTFSAFATWRTARIADSIYLAAERAYFGVERIILNDNSSR
jgi:hypothetical protein